MAKKFTLLLLALLLIAAPASAEELTLEKAIEMALAQNRTVQQADYARRAADWGLWQSVSAYLPRVDYNTTWTRLDPDTIDAADAAFEMQKQFAPDAEPSVFEDSYSSGISVIQPIFNGGAEIATIRSGAIGRKNAHLGEQDARLQVVLQVKQAYYGVMTARGLDKVAREALQLAKESLRLVQARYEVGSVTQSDVLRWEAEAASAEGAVAEAENTLAQTRMQLARVIGGAVGRQWELPELDPDNVVMLVGETEGVDAAGVATPVSINDHPLARQTAGQVKLAGVETDSSVTQLLPNVNFFYNYNWLTNDTMGPDEDTSWNLGVNLQIPLFRGFGRATGIGRAARNKHAAQAGYEEFSRTFVQRAYSSKLNLRSARLRVISARKAVKASAANLEIIESRAGLGMVTNLELLDAQIAYLQARSSLIGASSDFYVALADWEYVSAQSKE
jgi:outer membrane protein